MIVKHTIHESRLILCQQLRFNALSNAILTWLSSQSRQRRPKARFWMKHKFWVTFYKTRDWSLLITLLHHTRLRRISNWSAQLLNNNHGIDQLTSTKSHRRTYRKWIKLHSLTQSTASTYNNSCLASHSTLAHWRQLWGRHRPMNEFTKNNSVVINPDLFRAHTKSWMINLKRENQIINECDPFCLFWLCSPFEELWNDPSSQNIELLIKV